MKLNGPGTDNMGEMEGNPKIPKEARIISLRLFPEVKKKL